MIHIDGQIIWSASDLTSAAECEYKVLRLLDVKLGRHTASKVEGDPFMAQIAALGDRHEEAVLADMRAT